MKKTKVGSIITRSTRHVMPIEFIKLYQCNGEMPCKRCQDSGWICTTRATKANAHKRPPPG